MNKILILVFLTIGSYSSDNIINTKNCEQIKLSTYTTLISCQNMDYLVEYQDVRRDDEDNIKKITLITQKDQKILVNKK